jgi:hypothetical protein
MSQHRKHRGYQTERIVADYFREHGWPYAEPTGAGRQGSDLTGVPGLDVEVKARRDLDLTGTLRQQAERTDAMCIAVIRPDGYGPARIDEWPVLMTLRQAIQLLGEAGYGNGVD